MVKKMKTAVVFSLVVSVFAVLCIGLASCSNNPLANTTWRTDDGNRTLTFTESTFRWERKDNSFNERGTYTISKEVVVLTFDRTDDYFESGSNKQTGSLESWHSPSGKVPRKPSGRLWKAGVLSFTAELEPYGKSDGSSTRINVEFYRIR